MKTIKINRIEKNGKLYSVCLGNGTINNFTSSREASAFLSSTNRFLTQQMYEIRGNFADVWNAYHRAWGLFDNDKKSSPKADLYNMERSCVENLDGVRKSFDLAEKRAGFTNGNYFAFIHFNYAIDRLEETVRILSHVHSNHSDYVGVNAMDVICKRLLYNRNELQNFGRYATTKLFKVPTHISEDASYVPPLAELKVA